MEIIKYKYKLTMVSSFVGIFIQAIITNLTAILFIPMMHLYDLSYKHLGILVAINFCAQIGSDIIFANKIDKLGYKKLIIPSTIIAFIGLILFGTTPFIFKDNIFIGFCIATVIFASSSGLLEILLSPLVDAIEKEEAKYSSALSLMHSFYAWGQVVTIIGTTILLVVLGTERWFYIPFVWAIVPVINFFMFSKSNFPKTIENIEEGSSRKILKNPIFLLAIGAIMFGGATEVIMNQWTSTFMENSLGLDKTTGDLLGMCGFAVMLGTGRALYGKYGEKYDIKNFLMYGALLAALSYIVVAISPIAGISVIACILAGLCCSLLWPGTLVICADYFKNSGAWMFATLAVAGDIGAAIGPFVTGNIIDSGFMQSFAMNLATQGASVEQITIRVGILISAIFPLIAFMCHFKIKKSLK